jgi:hypothetical protein
VGELFDEQLINRMRYYITRFFILLVFISSQNVQVNIITRQNDTIKEFRLKRLFIRPFNGFGFRKTSCC